jgi:hypothetical protein
MNIIEKYTDWLEDVFVYPMMKILFDYTALGVLLYVISSPLWLMIILSILLLLPIQLVLDIIRILSNLKEKGE